MQSTLIVNSQDTTFFKISQQESFTIGQGILIDFDSDNDLDFVGSTGVDLGSCLQALKNDGNGSFSNATQEVFGVDSIKLIRPGTNYLVDDFNNDGRNDLFILDMGLDDYPWGGAPNYLFIQTTDGKLIDESNQRLPDIVAWTYSGDHADIDNDGDIDVYCNQHFLSGDSVNGEMVMYEEGYAGIYINDGNGYFSYDTTRLPRIVTITRNGFGTPSFFDIDHDNDLDIFSGSAPSIFSGVELTEISHFRDVILFNDGTGNFTYQDSMIFPIHDPLYFESEGQPSVPIEDINNDGWDDILEVRSRQTEWVEGGSPRLKLYLNNRNGTFRHADYMLPELENFDFPFITDFNNDGMMDFIISSMDNGFKLYLNRENVNFVDVSHIVPLSFDWYQMTYPDDLDNDGDQDIFITTGTEFYVIKNKMPYSVLDSFPVPSPLPPDLVSPVNNAIVSEEAVLSWQDSLETGCRIQISSNLDFSTIVFDTTDYQLDTILIKDLTVYQTYYWRVNSTNVTGTSDWSEIRSFITTKVPQLNYPISGEIVSVNPKLNWYGIIQVGSYDIQIADDDLFSDIIVNTSTSDTSYTVSDSLEYLKSYYWRVRAKSDTISGNWSNVGYFKTEIILPTQQNLLLFGTENVAIAPQNVLLNLDNTFTIATWLYQDIAENASLIGAFKPTYDPGVHYNIEIDNNGTGLRFTQTTGQPGEVGEVFSPFNGLGTWVHVAVVLSNENMIQYINGEEVGRASSPGAPALETLPITVGNNINEFGDLYNVGFNGKIAQLSVWNKALTNEEIQGLIRSNLNGNESGLIAYWPLDDGQGQIARDLSPNHLDLQLGTTDGEDINDPYWICTSIPEKAEKPVGESNLCQNDRENIYRTSKDNQAVSYKWAIEPVDAGILSTMDTSCTVNWNKNYSGTASLCVKALNSCEDGEWSDTLSIHINSIFSNSENVSICSGDSLFIADHWINESGTYFDSLKTVYGCDSLIITNLTVNQLPYIFLGNDTTINSSITLDAGGGFADYLWNTGENSQIILVDDSYGLGMHEFTVIVTDYNDCANSDTILITINEATLVNELPFKLKIKIYPNPSEGELMLGLSGIDDIVNIQLISSIGSIVVSKAYENDTQDILNLNQLNNGVYFLVIKYRDVLRTEKIIINN